jgi:hypothetical protein
MWSQLCRQVEMAQRIPKARIKRYEVLAAQEALSEYAAQFTKPPIKRKLDTYVAYAALLQKLLEKLRRHRDSTFETPAATAKAKGMLESGMHWMHWIPEEIRVTFTQALADVHEYPEVALTPFPNVVYKVPPRPSRKRAKEKSPIELLRDECKALDKDYLLDPTPQKKAVLDAKMEALVAAKKAKAAEKSAAQYARKKAERNAFRERLQEAEK